MNTSTLLPTLTRDELLAAAEAARYWPTGRVEWLILKSDRGISSPSEAVTYLDNHHEDIRCCCPAVAVALCRTQRDRTPLTSDHLRDAMEDLLELWDEEEDPDGDAMLVWLEGEPHSLASRLEELAASLPAEAA